MVYDWGNVVNSCEAWRGWVWKLRPSLTTVDGGVYGSGGCSRVE